MMIVIGLLLFYLIQCTPICNAMSLYELHCESSGFRSFVKLKPQRGKYNGVIEIICIFQLYRSVAFLNATPQALSLKSNHN